MLDNFIAEFELVTANGCIASTNNAFFQRQQAFIFDDADHLFLYAGGYLLNRGGDRYNFDEYAYQHHSCEIVTYIVTAMVPVRRAS